jgi:hypothetical protein
MRIVKEVYVSWRAEVVFVTSNRQGNQEIMGGCMDAGIPVFVSSPVPGDSNRQLIPGLREHCGTSKMQFIGPVPFCREGSTYL